MALGREVDLGPGDIVLDGEWTELPPKGHSPQFVTIVCCGQTAGWMKGAQHPASSADVCCGQTVAHLSYC